MEELEDFQECHNLDYLIKYFFKTNTIPGSCKEVSTVTTGVLYDLGLTSRLMSGTVLYTEDYDSRMLRLNRQIEGSKKRIEDYKKKGHGFLLQNELELIKRLKDALNNLHPDEKRMSGGGHNWTEVYISNPNSKGRWALVDPAGGNVGDYPDAEEAQYIADCNLPLFKNHYAKTAKIKVDYKE